MLLSDEFALKHIFMDLFRRHNKILKKNSDDQRKPVGMRNVGLLGLVSLFTDFSTEMVSGILPVFIVSDLGASRAILGAIEGSGEFLGYSFRLVSGTISDKIGRRKIFILMGYGLSTLSKPFFYLTNNWFDAFIVRASDRTGKRLGLIDEFTFFTSDVRMIDKVQFGLVLDVQSNDRSAIPDLSASRALRYGVQIRTFRSINQLKISITKEVY